LTCERYRDDITPWLASSHLGNSTCDVHPDRIAHRWRLDHEEFVEVYVTSWTRRTKLLEHLHDLFLGDLKHSNPRL
jgi:hypothetical protein